jgi:hypothetical protein
MIWDMVEVEVLRLHALGWSVRAIARQTGLSRMAVHRIVQRAMPWGTAAAYIPRASGLSFAHLVEVLYVAQFDQTGIGAARCTSPTNVGWPTACPPRSKVPTHPAVSERDSHKREH